MDNGYIYVIKVLEYYKIGKIKDIKTRIGEYTKLMENPEIVICYYVHDYHYIEKYLHEKYKDKNTRGEWFKLENHDIRCIEEILKFNRVLNNKEKLIQFNEFIKNIELNKEKIFELIMTERNTYKIKFNENVKKYVKEHVIDFETDNIDVAINKIIQFITKYIYKYPDDLL